MNYDTSLFIEIIESIDGVVFLRSDFLEGIHLRFYKGKKGKLVVIETTFEDLTPTQGIGYLVQLGLEDLIPSIFPNGIV